MHVHVNIDKHIKKKQKQTSGLTKWRWNLIYQWFETQSTSYILQLISNQINCPLINKKIKLTGMVDRVCPKIPFLYHFTRILINRTKFLIINNILIEDINTFSHQFKQFTLIYVTFLKLISWYEMSALLFPEINFLPIFSSEVCGFYRIASVLLALYRSHGIKIVSQSKRRHWFDYTPTHLFI